MRLKDKICSFGVKTLKAFLCLSKKECKSGIFVESAKEDTIIEKTNTIQIIEDKDKITITQEDG